MSFDNCHARSGGAVKASRNRPKKEGSNSVRWSSNNEHSCINKLRRNVKGTMVIKGKIDFSRCWADSGGAIRTHTSVNMSTGSASFRSCTANAFGGAIFSKNVYLSQDVSFSEVTALSGGLIFARGEVKMLGGRVMNCSPPQVMAEQRLEIANVSFTGTTQVRLGAPDISAERVQCQNGLRSFKSDKDQGCSRCDENGLQIDRGPVLDNRVNITECVPGPRGALRVESGYLKMKVGHMVDPRNVSRGFFCPNRYACIGGKASVDGSSPMCDAGYEGLGCVECSAAYGPSDSNSLVCVPCAESQMQRINQLARFFLQDLVLFCLSAGGVASSTGRQKVSAVLTNQFMSFAAVAGPVLLAVRQTESFKHAAYSLDEYVDGLSTLVQVGEGASTGGMSVNCILRYLGFSPTWQAEALLTLLTPACAMLALTAIRGLRIAIVVGVNCFLAKICLFFGRYLVCFRMEPEDLGGEVICEYVRHTSLSFASLMTIVVVVMVAGPISWVVLLNDERNTKAGFYLYLTAQYRDEVKFWEVTRLVRKILLAVICAVYPITLHPLTQILCISLILLAALVMEMRFLPYLSHSWNSSEQMLLVISMAMVCITSFYLANERHWSTSRSSQCVLLGVILALTIGPSYMQVTLILRQLLRERFGE
ncbi:unnamed protein product [Effrenium voratum]|nr:unnamed protein product [Effrenium voratum]